MKIAIPEFGPPQSHYYTALMKFDADAVQVSDIVDPAEYDGLLLPGGVDINPELYGCDNLGSVGINDKLDKMQYNILDCFIKAGKPVLGICRGHQLIGVYFGLKLIQNLTTCEIHVKDNISGIDSVHRVTAVPETPLYKLYGSVLTVNSSHHQAVSYSGNGLMTMAMSDDGVIEALYHKNLPVFSVQWHPERMCFDYASDKYCDGSLIFKAFIDKCLLVKNTYY